MTNFNIGDTVKVINDHGCTLDRGNIYTVLDTDSRWNDNSCTVSDLIKIEIDPGYGYNITKKWFSPSRFELVEKTHKTTKTVPNQNGCSTASPKVKTSTSVFEQEFIDTAVDFVAETVKDMLDEEGVSDVSELGSDNEGKLDLLCSFITEVGYSVDIDVEQKVSVLVVKNK